MRGIETPASYSCPIPPHPLGTQKEVLAPRGGEADSYAGNPDTRSLASRRLRQKLHVARQRCYIRFCLVTIVLLLSYKPPYQNCRVYLDRLYHFLHQLRISQKYFKGAFPKEEVESTCILFQPHAGHIAPIAEIVLESSLCSVHIRIWRP